ncbi:MAG: serine/threonine protein kinase, partial [Archangium sp.]
MSTAPKRQPIPFGKYLLLDRVNIGGMAEVWRAKTFGAGGFERIVAIKRILPNIAEDEEFITMFIDEAKITVQLNHANIAQIYELANLSNSYFIAMEYVSGKDMRAVFDRCRKRGEPAPIPLTCYVIAQCCEGLDYAHRAKDKQGRDMGIVHRDVSPQNALISYDGEVKVIDFGIAKAAGKATKTQAGILKGKFGYMSPEQIRGLPLDGRSDIFAIGVCLYEMLTGERLFVGDSDFSVLEKVRKVEVLPPSHFNRKIPEQLEKIVMKALAKDVDDRYQHAGELGEDLRAFMYSTGNAFARKDLAAFMKATFAEDFEKEKMRISEYVEVKAPEGMLAAIEMGYGVGAVPAPSANAPNASSVTAVPTSVPINPAPGGPPVVRPVPPTLTPSGGAPVTRPPSLTSMPRLTAVAPMLTNGKEEHESTVLADGIGGGPPFSDDPATNPGGGPQQR